MDPIFSSADLERIRAAGRFASVEYHGELGSTNDHAAELAGSRSLPRPFLVLAERQMAGRGRGSNVWWSAPGALTFSVVVNADDLRIPADRTSQVSLAAGLAVCESIEHFAPRPPSRLKWPNDVFLDGKKVSGILVEAPAFPAADLVIGIGINVNNSFAAAPDEISATGTSLLDATAMSIPLPAILERVIDRLNSCLRMLAQQPGDLLANWRKRCLLTGRQVEIAAGSRRSAGRCLGIDDAGRLILETPNGRETHISGTIERFD